MPTARSLTCATIGLALLGAAAGSADAAPKKTKRTVTLTYDNPCAVTLQSDVVYGPYVAYCPAEQNIVTKTGETYVTISAKDQTGQPVGFVFQENNGQTPNDNPVTLVCGSAKNLRVRKAQYDFFPSVAAGSSSCPVPATTGTVTFTISNYKL